MVATRSSRKKTQSSKRSPAKAANEYSPDEWDSVSDPSGEEYSKRCVVAAKKDKSGKVYRIYCDGIFDLFHVGHMKMLEQAKKSLGDSAKVHLLVGVCSDELTHKLKGKTVMDHKTRCESAEHCK